MGETKVSGQPSKKPVVQGLVVRDKFLIEEFDKSSPKQLLVPLLDSRITSY